MDTGSSREIVASLQHAWQEQDEESVLAALKELTNHFRVDSFRCDISAGDLLLLADVFKGYSGQVISEGTAAVNSCTECVRCLRNACVQCVKNQEAITSVQLLQSFQNLIRYSLDKEILVESELILLRCCIQCLNNVASGRAEGQALVWNHILRPLLPSLFGLKDSKMIQYSCTLVQTCLMNPECAESFGEDPNVPRLMDTILILCSLQTDHDFILQLVQMIIRSPTVIPKVFEKLTLSSQITLLDITNACVTDEAEGQYELDILAESISEETLRCFADKFSNIGHHILSLAMRNSDSDQTPQLVTSLLDLLCSASAKNSLQSHVQSMERVLETSLELLDMVEQVGRSSDNTFTISQDFAASSRGGAGQQGPGYGFKRNLVQLLGNMCFRNRGNQDKVRELNGIPSILQQCNIDSKNAFINQWAILAIRNLCEDNLQNQAYIASLKNHGAADNDALAKLGFEAVLRDDGQVYLKNIKKN